MSRLRDTGHQYANQAVALATAVHFFFLLAAASVTHADPPPLRSADIRIRDPFILADPVTKKYYLYAKGINRESGTQGWECYVGDDLEHWSRPVNVFTPPEDFWADRDFWAPEVFHYGGKYYLFGTLSKRGVGRGTQIFIGDGPLGPFRPHSDRAATPHEWLALDGTLFVEDGKPWIVFCRQWLRIQNGTIEAAPLSDDLRRMKSKPTTLFRGGDAPWVRPYKRGGFITDGPCLYRHAGGELLMLWSSFGKKGYAVGIARSQSGKILGPWTHDEKPLHEEGGHCMIFKTFAGETLLALHAPDTRGKERLRLFLVEETEAGLRLKAGGTKGVGRQRPISSSHAHRRGLWDVPPPASLSFSVH